MKPSLTKASNLLLLLLMAAICAAEEKAPWPKQLLNRSSPKITSPKETTSPYTYTSQRFRFISDQKIAIDKMRAFALTAESVPAAVSKIPLPLLSLPKTPGDEKPAIYIFSDEEDFVRAGGKHKSSGYYSGRKQSVYLKADHFINVPSGRLPNYNLLVHELVHLSQHGILGKVPPWFSEGNAEYISAAFIPKGSYRFDDMPRSIPAHAKKFVDTRKVIELPPLRTLITLSNREWGEYITNLDEGDSPYPHYLAALILTHYVYHLDPQGREKSKRYIELLQKRRPLQEANAMLFPADTLNSLPGNLETYWRKRGLKIRFQK